MKYYYADIYIYIYLTVIQNAFELKVIKLKAFSCF